LAGRREEPAIPCVLQRADLRGVATLDDQLDRARRRSGLRLAGRGLSRHGGAASHEDTGEDDAEQASGDHSRHPHVIVCESATLLWLTIESANPNDFAVTTPGAGLIPHGAPPLYFTFATLAKLGLPHATTTRHCPGTAVWGEPQPLVGPEAVAALATIGPSIGPCCYEVDAPVVSEFRAAYPSMWERWARPAAPGRFMLDLWMANEALVAAAGVDPARIDNPRLCTACHPDLLYSYRKGNRGRLVTFAALP